jgi:hypothetical protein
MNYKIMRQPIEERWNLIGTVSVMHGWQQAEALKVGNEI